MRPKAMRSPLGSTTATFIAQPRLVASSTAALNQRLRPVHRDRRAIGNIERHLCRGWHSDRAAPAARPAPPAAGHSLTCGKQAGRQRQYSQSTRLHLGLLPYRRHLFGRCHDLRRKKAARASEVRALGAPCLLRLLASGRSGSKTIYQPCGQRNERAAQRTGIGIVSSPARRRAGFCSAGVFAIFAAAIAVGARCSRKPLM